MLPRYDYGDAVRLTRSVRNDGSFPGVPAGTLLVRRGSTGHVVNIGTFLQDQIVYTVHFLDIHRGIGCAGCLRKAILRHAGSLCPGRIDPAYMYIGTKAFPGEVEIARVALASVTADVISVRARPAGDRIRYRICEEYGTEFAGRPLTSRRPLTLGQFQRRHLPVERRRCPSARPTSFGKDKNPAADRW